MPQQSFEKIKSLSQLYSILPDHERIMVDVLRQIVLHTLPDCKEKISFNVPYFYKNKGICIIWPAKVPRGGIKSGVLFGIWYGNKIRDPENYLKHGTNKQVFYKIFQSADEIKEKPLIKLLKEAKRIDDRWKL